MARGLAWQTLQIPFSSGLETKEDPRFSSPPRLDIARDLWFEAIGGLQTRAPFAAFTNTIFGGGALSSCRKLAVVNGELCVFTDTSLYSWNAQLSQWVLRGTHLAATVDETPRFVTTGDQIDSDRAELSNTVVYAWTEGAQVYAAAYDKATGSTLTAPTAVSTAIGRPRLVALTTKILLFADAGANNLTVRAIDPAAPGTAISGAGTSALAGNYNAYYDVERVPASDTAIAVCRRVTTTAYSILKVTAALAVSSATPGRTCDGPIAVAVDPAGTDLQVIRGNGTNVQGDLVTVSGLADVLTAEAVGTVAGTPINQIAVEYSTVKVGGQYVATAWWDAQENAGTAGFVCKTNTVDQAGAVGTAKTMPAWLGLASRAFERNGSIYAWLVFAGDSTVSGTGVVAGLKAQLQNTYFLYRSDGFLVAKATAGSAGGFAPSTGRLPAVSQTGANTYAWCGSLRHVIDLGGDHTGYADRDPNEIVTTFDTNDARRSAQHGKTLYVTGGLLLQYDGLVLAEVGFLVFPWAFSTAPLGGAVPAGTYYYKCTLRWPNAQGEQERSTTATVGTFVNPGASKAALSIAALTVTRKTGSSRPPAVEVWRTVLITATGDPPFYLTTSKDPAAVGDNGYVANDATSGGFLAAFSDNFIDATLQTKETNPENGSFLEFLPPPPATIVFTDDTRLLLLGVAGDPDRGWYSRERNIGEIASFHDGLTFDIPPDGGDVTAGWFQDGVLYVGRQYALYALPGSGLDNLGQGQGFGPARIVSLDVGPVSQEAQALTPVGTLFKSAKGWQLLERSGTVRYIGGPVSSFDADTVLAMHVITAKHQVRILTNNRMILWDYRGAVDTNAQDFGGNWSEWTVSDGLDACLWQGQYVYLTATGPKLEQSALSGLTYGIDAETSWIKLNDLQGFGKVGALELLGEYRGAGLVRVRVARDYQYDGSGNVVYYDDKAWSPSPATVGSALQVRHSPSASNGNCEAIKIRITAVVEGVRATLAALSMSPQVATSGTPWAATWQARSTYPGVMGNALSMSISFGTFTPGALAALPTALPIVFQSATGLVAINDHYTWSSTLTRWTESIGTIGVFIAGVVAASELEAAIGAGTSLATLLSADPTPSKTIDAAGMLAAGHFPFGRFSAGAYGAPTGEVFRLTGLGLEVGLDPRLYKRLPAGQKQ